jgi:hypothetical protein
MLSHPLQDTQHAVEAPSPVRPTYVRKRGKDGLTDPIRWDVWEVDKPTRGLETAPVNEHIECTSIVTTFNNTEPQLFGKRG